MNDCITNILRKDMNLYRSYARAEAKYILGLGEKFVLLDVDIDMDDKSFKKIIRRLAKEGMCLDEFVVEYLKEQFSKLENKDEKTSKHTRNKKNRKN